MVLGLNGATTLKVDLATDIRAAKAAGYGCIEIWAPKLLGYSVTGSLADLRRSLRRAGLPVAALNSVERVTFQDPSGNAGMLQDFTRSCRVASTILFDDAIRRAAALAASDECTWFPLGYRVGELAGVPSFFRPPAVLPRPGPGRIEEIALAVPAEG